MTIRSRLDVLLAERKMHGEALTTEELSEKIGVAQSTISNLVNNRTTRISFETLDKLCKFFKCTPNDILLFTPDSEEEATEQDKEREEQWREALARADAIRRKIAARVGGPLPDSAEEIRIMREERSDELAGLR